MDVDALVTERGVDRKIYVDETVYREEIRKIFGRTWVYVAHESEVRAPGEFKTTTIGETPVIVVRDDDGQLRVVINRCRHRALTVCEAARGTTKFFRCIYHGWTYGTDGALTGVPYPAGYGTHFSRADYGLQPVARVDTYRGFIFASLAPEGDSLREHLAGAAPFLDAFADAAPDGDLEARRGEHKYLFDGNWKFQLENSVDGYHPFFVHRSFFNIQERHSQTRTRVFEDTSTAQTLDLGNGHGAIDQRAAMGDTYFTRVRIAPGGEALVAGLEAAYGPERTRSLINAVAGNGFNLAVFPNLVLLGVQIRVVKPQAPNRTLVEVIPTTLKGLPESLNRMRLRTHEAFFGPAGFGAPDDVEVFRRAQRGLAAEGVGEVLMARGLERERREGEVVIGEVSDETPQRALYKKWGELMAAPDRQPLAV
jgi:phenylpropionate dioxygenase-like ring-hydroxylating dioxygenase large terminal subunit